MPIGLTLAGATLGAAALSTAGGFLQNRSQIASAREQMEFQKDMSNTAYQRAMKDMRKAGLNPILAGKVGGASTPSGAQPNIRNPLEGLPTSAANYVAAKTASANISNLQSQTKLNEANSALALEKAVTETKQQQKIVVDTGLSSAQTKKIGFDIRQVEAATGLTAQQASNAAQTFQNLIKEGQIKSQQLTQEQKKAVYAAIQTKVYETGVGKAQVWLETLGFGKPSEWISGAARFFGKKGAKKGAKKQDNVKVIEDW